MFDKLDAKLDQVTGSAKELAGKALGDKGLQAEGLVDKLVGKAKEVVADVTADVDSAVDKAKDLASDAKDALDGAVDSLKDKF